MTPENQDRGAPALNSKETAMMAKHGITCVAVNNFYCGGYRYTDLKDAVAQSLRQTAQR